MLTKIFLYFGALLGIAFIILAIVQLKNEQQVDRIWRSLPGIPTGDRFTKDMVAELPPPVQRYFLHSIAPGTSLASSVCLEMSGSFRMVQDQPWIPMRAKQITSVLKGFVWKAVIDNGWFKFMGADYYANKCGGMCFSLWGLIPLVNARSSDITRSSIGRFAGEFFWLPSALLPQRNVNWKAIDERTIQANFKIDGERIILTLIIDVDGKLLKLFFPRWGQHISDGSYSYIPFGENSQKKGHLADLQFPPKLLQAGGLAQTIIQSFFEQKLSKLSFIK
uniref:HoxF, ORF, hoxU, ORF8, hoxY genes n=1 Tax=Anabaena variabilis TaxID=264691 RepID=Q9AJC0_ANAVA|nr:unnamed protein product [Trichormus variabilis]